jgi:hypothetical protein
MPSTTNLVYVNTTLLQIHTSVQSCSVTTKPTPSSTTMRHTQTHTTHKKRPRLSGAARALRTALQHAAYEWGNSAPAIVPDRRAKRRCGQLRKRAREIASLSPYRVLWMLQICTSLPACVSPSKRNSMCATGEERLHAPPLLFRVAELQRVPINNRSWFSSVLPQMRSLPLPSTSLPIHSSLSCNSKLQTLIRQDH